MTNGGTGTADLLAPCRSNARFPFFFFFFFFYTSSPFVSALECLCEFIEILFLYMPCGEKK
jgi:hypothetical protein